MAVVVSLRDVVNELVGTSDEIHAYLNKETGELVSITDEEIQAIENEDDWGEFPEWQHEALELASKILDSDSYLALPSRFEIHEYAIMERFCGSIQDQVISDDLVDQIKGSGAFRRFKAAIRRYGIEDQWYQFRDRALEEIAIEWLEEHGIAIT